MKSLNLESSPEEIKTWLAEFGPDTFEKLACPKAADLFLYSKDDMKVSPLIHLCLLLVCAFHMIVLGARSHARQRDQNLESPCTFTY